MTRVSACFYNSLDPLSVVSAVLVKIKYPTTEFYNINGLTVAQIDALVGGLTAASYHDIYVVCDKTASNFTVGLAVAFVSAANITTLDTKLIAIAPPQDPVPDAATQDFSAQDNGQIAPDRKLRPLMVFEFLWTSSPVAKLVALLGGYLLSAGDQVDSVSLYSGIRAKRLALTNSAFLQDLIDAIDENSRLSLDVTTTYPQDLDIVNELISEGETVTTFISATGVAFPEAPIEVP
jgi:hypothetical protein